MEKYIWGKIKWVWKATVYTLTEALFYTYSMLTYVQVHRSNIHIHVV